MGILLSGGTVVTAADCYRADVLMEDGRIVAVGERIGRPEDEVLSVDGCFLFPGGIDPHTHFDLPVSGTVTADDFASGTRAALLGGTTTIIDFATQFAGESLQQALDNWHARAAGKCYTDYAFHMAITDWTDRTAGEMSRLVAEAGVSSFKFYMAYKGTLQVDDGVLLQALTAAKSAGALICLHCENGDMIQALVDRALAAGHVSPRYHALTRPPVVEQEATERALVLAGLAGAPVYIVHLTCGGALRAVVEARLRGVEVYAETCPQYLLLDENCYQKEGFEGAKYVMSPPLRFREEQQVLWSGLESGLVDTVATDHCSFNFKGQKELGLTDFSRIPGGIPGVENRMGLLYTYGVATGRISLHRFVDLTSTRAARLFGLYPRKGTIAVGSDADIVVWDPRGGATITAGTQQQRVDYTPYEGFEQKGRPVHVFLRGRQVVKDGRLCDGRPRGEYLPRKPFAAKGGAVCIP
ncbi:dihydropyrimidinase [Desulfotomaculum copahuensis]|uniref:Dihydropyrimidinase n=1 Tax=Desulfotomaculum copahuensis TaxID=1838280 RepID=A0A1B7LIS9_9FIRM|nr:dihydropyrimidinase [Desulfotomaculum copahuensis]OAT86480.1 dihydropyrimidinase [Desulfotomaculum copahuensis]